MRPCDCTEVAAEPRLIVLTGGPGAGKTAVLELIRQSFCEHTAIVPEAASIVFGGGFLRSTSLSGRRAGQRAIFHVQREHERMLLEEKRHAVILCDRGTLDGLAYWPGTREEFLSEFGIRLENELKRYSAVIQLRTPSLEMGYNHSNPVRTESAHEASVIDQRLAEIWSAHPKHFLIESGEEFLQKAIQAVEVLRKELPECCRKHRIAGESRL